MALQTSHREIGRVLDASLSTFDIQSVLEQIKKEQDWRKEERNAIILHKGSGLRVVLVAMHAGTSIPRHTADCPISLQVVEGGLRFNAGSRSVTMHQGQILTLHRGIPHDVEAMGECAFLLTLATRKEHPAEG